MSGPLNVIPSLHLPVEESTPSDMWLLTRATVPLAVVTFGLGFLMPVWVRVSLVVIVALVWRYSPWFRRPESVMLNVYAGGFLGELALLILRHTLR